MNQSGRMENAREALGWLVDRKANSVFAAALAEVEEWEELIEAVDDVIDWHREHESVPSLYPLLQIMWRRREKLSEVAS